MELLSTATQMLTLPPLRRACRFAHSPLLLPTLFSSSRPGRPPKRTQSVTSPENPHIMPHSVPGLMSPGMIPPTGTLWPSIQGSWWLLLRLLMIHTVAFSSVASFLSPTHTLTRTSAHPHTRPASLPVASPQLVLEMAASPKWHMHPTTRHQLLTRLPKTDPLLNPRKPGAGRINWSGDLFSQISRCCILPEVHSN